MMIQPSSDIQQQFEAMDPPVESVDSAFFGDDFPAELALVSRLWFACGYRPGIGAYLNFFLLKDFIETHDNAFPPRFANFKAMADSFYQTDLFIRDVTDSGKTATGGISSKQVRKDLAGIMDRHRNVNIPLWMMTYFGFSLLENVEKQVSGLTDAEKQQHLEYMHKTYRIMGVPFSNDRSRMESYARTIEQSHTATSDRLREHAARILFLGELIGISSAWDSIGPMLPETTRKLQETFHAQVRPGLIKRLWGRVLGKLLMKQAVGQPRKVEVKEMYEV